MLFIRTSPRLISFRFRYLSTSRSLPRDVPILPNTSISTFRGQAFHPSKPALLPRSHFLSLPATQQWFISTPTTDSSVCQLNYALLEPNSQFTVPLELIQKKPSKDGQLTFVQLHAPLKVFLDWTRSPSAAKSSGQNLYLAQAQVMDLSQELQAALPTPNFVKEAGRGDVYDTNIWLGLGPTYTPLHRDPNPNLFVQMAGTKIVRLVEPILGREIFRRVQTKLGVNASSVFRGEEMMQGKERELLEEEVWGMDVDAENFYETRLGRGDGLFIPKGWWHSLRGIGEGIIGSVNWWFR
ncbi:MAG: hypothetical protein M1834_001858 [Cirrosporium novae-zelandiae]|nr:MAG: hypothetical protein M1834_001858 [Cirrosporium novae-zelandiae]